MRGRAAVGLHDHTWRPPSPGSATCAFGPCSLASATYRNQPFVTYGKATAAGWRRRRADPRSPLRVGALAAGLRIAPAETAPPSGRRVTAHFLQASADGSICAPIRPADRATCTVLGTLICAAAR